PIQKNSEIVAGPRRTAQQQSECLRPAQRELQRTPIAVRESRVHRYGRAGGLPLRSRRHVQVNPKLIVRLVVDAVAMQSMTLHAAADATRKTVKHVLVF